MERVIIHIDMDAFFSSVEVLDNPKLRGKPVVVGGVSERGVVATCSYEARKYGIRSAMPIYKAKALCPNAIFLPTRISRYKEVSSKVFEILHRITGKIEPVSIDEAYLDITDINEDAYIVAKRIKKLVMDEVKLTLSVGISYNKFLAKLASDWNKPNGIKIIDKEMIPGILWPLSIGKVHGLGKQMERKLNNMAIFNIKELYDLDKEFLYEYFGKQGIEIYYRIRGMDNREVITTRERKSIGKEITLKNDTKDKDELKKYLKIFSFKIEEYLKRNNLSGRTLTVKIKTASFENHTKSRTLNTYISTNEEIYIEALEILNSIELKEDIRLIGLTISSLGECEIEQLKLF